MGLIHFIILKDDPKVVPIKDGGDIVGEAEELTSVDFGAQEASVAKITLWRPDVIHHHQEAEETYICLKGEGMIILDGRIHEFNPGTRVIIRPGTRHAARPKNSPGELVFLCISSPAFNSNDVHVQPWGHGDGIVNQDAAFDLYGNAVGEDIRGVKDDNKEKVEKKKGAEKKDPPRMEIRAEEKPKRPEVETVENDEYF